ncbi:hypothetical protein [Streptomyces sp. NPDC059649]|uniref:hypothetical protein n=1 Tax=Streptomyces sp. NPDC059649 TaxID=3346895 RepID=UPI0036972DB6
MADEVTADGAAAPAAEAAEHVRAQLGFFLFDCVVSGSCLEYHLFTEVGDVADRALRDEPFQFVVGEVGGVIEQLVHQLMEDNVPFLDGAWTAAVEDEGLLPRPNSQTTRGAHVAVVLDGYQMEPAVQLLTDVGNQTIESERVGHG